MNQYEMKEMSQVPYAQTVGNVVYVMTRIKPDICLIVGFVSRY